MWVDEKIVGRVSNFLISVGTTCRKIAVIFLKRNHFNANSYHALKTAAQFDERTTLLIYC